VNSLKPDVSIIIPAYNEENTIYDIVSRTLNSISKISDLSFEIIIVDDGSTDRTFEVVRKLGVIVLRNKHNRGKGNALRRGFFAARGKIMVTLDADGSHFPEDLPSVLAPIINGEADMVIGSRFGNKNQIPTTPLNLAGNFLFNLMIHILTRRRISDTQSGFRAFKRSLLKVLKINSTGYDIESEVLIKSLMRKYSLKEVDIRSIQRLYGNEKIHPFRDGCKILLQIVKTYLKASKNL